jgi:hypothetical protein
MQRPLKKTHLRCFSCEFRARSFKLTRNSKPETRNSPLGHFCLITQKPEKKSNAGPPLFIEGGSTLKSVGRLLGKKAFRPESIGLCLEGHLPVPFGWLFQPQGLPSTSSSLCLRPSGFLPSKSKPVSLSAGACTEARETSDTEAAHHTFRNRALKGLKCSC